MFVQPISYSISFRQCIGLLIHFHSSCFAHLRLLYYYTLFVVVFRFGRSSASSYWNTMANKRMNGNWCTISFTTYVNDTPGSSFVFGLSSGLHAPNNSVNYVHSYTSSIDMLPPLFSGKHRTMDNKVDILTRKKNSRGYSQRFRSISYRFQWPKTTSVRASFVHCSTTCN